MAVESELAHWYNQHGMIMRKNPTNSKLTETFTFLRTLHSNAANEDLVRSDSEGLFTMDLGFLPFTKVRVYVF